jgi:hypothetical protein
MSLGFQVKKYGSTQPSITYNEINAIFTTGDLQNNLGDLDKATSIEDLFDKIKKLTNGQQAINDFLKQEKLQMPENEFIRMFKEDSGTGANGNLQWDILKRKFIENTSGSSSGLGWKQPKLDINVDNCVLNGTCGNSGNSGIQLIDIQPSPVDISFILSDPKLSRIYMNTYRINVYEGTDCDEIRKDIIKLIKLLSVVSKELHHGKNDQYLIIMYHYLVKAIKDHIDYLQSYCPPSTTPPSGSPPQPPTSSSPLPPPSFPPSPFSFPIISTNYYEFYNYNGNSYTKINNTTTNKPDCNHFNNWKCVSGNEIIKYKIRYDGNSDVCPNCKYGIQMVIDHGWENGVEYYKTKYCGTGVCNPVPFVMPEGIHNLNENVIIKLLINVYTGRSLVYPDYYFITRYLGPNTYMIIPIYDPQNKCTQRIQEIYYYWTTAFNSEKTKNITEEEMQILKQHLFKKPEDIKLNTLYENEIVSLRILKKGNVYEVLIVKKSLSHKIVAAINKTNEEQKQIAELKLKEEAKKLEVVTHKLAEKAKTYADIESLPTFKPKHVYLNKDVVTHHGTIGLTPQPFQLSQHVIQFPICKTHIFSQEELNNFNTKEGIMITNINGVQKLVKTDGSGTIVGTKENLPNGQYKITYCE